MYLVGNASSTYQEQSEAVHWRLWRCGSCLELGPLWLLHCPPSFRHQRGCQRSWPSPLWRPGLLGWDSWSVMQAEWELGSASDWVPAGSEFERRMWPPPAGHGWPDSGPGSCEKDGDGHNERSWFVTAHFKCFKKMNCHGKWMTYSVSVSTSSFFCLLSNLKNSIPTSALPMHFLDVTRKLTCEDACVELSDWTAVTVAAGVKISCGERGTARPRFRATCTRLLCWAWKIRHKWSKWKQKQYKWLNNSELI